MKDGIIQRLGEARDRTLALVAPLDDEQLNTAYSEILSPLAWDLGHIANFEELWLVQTVGELEPMNGDLGRFYDAIENPRSTRNELPILRGDELRTYMADVRERTIEVLDGVDLDDGSEPLLRDGFVYELLIAHEHQHNETMMQLLQMIEGYEPVDPDAGVSRQLCEGGPQWVGVEAGEYAIGAGPGGFAYDNERPAHTAELRAFEIQRAPVSNGEFAAFVADTGAEPPLYWQADGAGGWVSTVFGRHDPIDPSLAVVHVDWQQADAYARWIGARLPSEFEWEAACHGSDPEIANLDQLGYGCAPAGAYGEGAADCGAVQMLGDVWEWTSSDFLAYPGFSAFPYPEYSEVFFGGDYKVLRGGAWATRRNVIRPSFRNWDHPIRRQIFSGFRCARSWD